MDSDIEIVEDDIVEDCHPGGLLTDFSQVRIEVHQSDVAERILDDLDVVLENPLEIAPKPQDRPENKTIQIQDLPEYDQGNYIIPDTIPENIEDITQDCTENTNIEDEDRLILVNDEEDSHGDYSEKDSCNYIDEETEPDNEEDSEPIAENDSDTAVLEQIQDDSFEDVTIKEEIEFFDATDYTDFDEAPAEIYKDDLPPEDIYHFNNKIILGTKPCPNMSELNSRRVKGKIQKEYLDTEVLLEDWGERLEQNPSFCQECGILFSTPNGLDSHNMTSHSFLVAVCNNKAVKSTSKPAFARKSTVSVIKNNMARKSTANSSMLVSKFCNHCNMEFPDHTDLIKHLYELLPFNKKFNCNKCKLTFKTQKELINHNIVHAKKEIPKVKKERIIKEEPNVKKKLLYEEDMKKKLPLSPKTEVDIIPISVLFQCPRCNAHFLNAFSGIQHLYNCFPESFGKRLVSCKICKRVLRDSDTVIHKKQHEICNKFKVYKIKKNLNELILCKCPKCEVHYSSLAIKLHLKKCGKIATARCLKCNILLPKSKIEEHMFKHDKLNLKTKDFIIIPTALHINKTHKRKLEVIDKPAKKIKVEKKLDAIVTPVKKIKIENKLEAIVKPVKKVKVGKDIAVADKKIHKVIASKIKKEPIITKIKHTGNKMKMANRLKFENNKIKLFYCKNCERCYMKQNPTTLEVHSTKRCQKKCLYNRTACEQCGLYFYFGCITQHSQDHRRNKFTIHDITFYNIQNKKRILPSIPNYPHCRDCKIKFINKIVKKDHICGENYKTCGVCGDKFDIATYKLHIEFHKLVKTQPQSKNTDTKIMPELIKKYDSLNMMWNIMYSCTECDIVTDAYDKAVEHSQKHLNDKTTLKNIKCYICNLKFDESCWSKHSDLHSQMKINSKDFQILNYNPHDLLSDKWFELFDSLSKEQIAQITDKSLYGYERGVPMKLLKDGRSEFTLHCCDVCKVCFQSNEITKHMFGACKNPTNVCKSCNIPFADANTLRFHELQHLKGIQIEEFRIVTFLKEDIKRSKFVIKKCTNCQVCIRHSRNYVRHSCMPKSLTATCKTCHLVFHKRLMARHTQEHMKKPDFNKNNIRIEFFNSLNKNNIRNIGENIKPVKRKYQGDHHKILKPAKVPKTNTPKPVKAGTANMTKSVTPKTAKTEVKIAKVFKCECGLHYTSPKTIEKHIETCSLNLNISKENCSKCGLLFPTDVLVSHLCKHHSKNTKIVTELYKKSVEPESSLESVESTSETPTSQTANSAKDINISIQNCSVKLYKCSECNVYYMNQNTCYKHVYKAHQPLNPKQYIECKLCGLQFTVMRLPVHVSQHHQNEFSLDKVLVEEYSPRITKGPPRIQIYVAAEKLQSLQVTSSNQ